MLIDPKKISSALPGKIRIMAMTLSLVLGAMLAPSWARAASTISSPEGAGSFGKPAEGVPEQTATADWWKYNPTGGDAIGQGQNMLNYSVFAISYIWSKVAPYFLIIAVFLIILGGSQMIISIGSQEAYKKGQDKIKWGLIFVVVPILPGVLIDIGTAIGTNLNILTTTNGFLRPQPGIQDLNVGNAVINLSGLILSIIGAIAIITLIIGATLWIFSTGREEIVERGKRTVQYSIVGLIFIVFSYSIVRLLSVAAYGGGGFFEGGGVFHVAIYGKIAATLMYIIGPAALVAIMIAAYITIVSHDKEHLDRAKKILLYAVGGLILALMSYALVEMITTLTAGEIVPPPPSNPAS